MNYNFGYSYTHSDEPILSFIVIILMWIIPIVATLLRSYTMSFSSIKEEVQYSNEKHYDADKHLIISMLKETKRDYFVLAYLQERKEIVPAVYTRYGKRVKLMNLRIEDTYYKKIYFDNERIDENTSVRIRRLKNKSTKTQMIFFASAVKNLEIYINNIKVPEIDCQGRTKNFTVYGIVDTPETIDCNVVNINGTEYDLIDNLYGYTFINKSELK